MLWFMLLLFGSGFGSVGGGGTVFPSSFAIEAGLGGRFDDVLVNEAFVQGAWSLSQTKIDTVRDITGYGNHGTISGSGLTRGVTCPLPEGALAITSTGSAKVSVAYAETLCLANGSMDVVVKFKTSTNDATLRCLIHCQETDSAGNGWHMAIQNGQVRGFLRVSGSTIFNFGRGSIADGNWHVAHLCYEPENGECRIFIDGVQSGATVTGVTTEPAVTSATLDMMQFADGSGGFIGTFAKAMCGREGNPDLGPALEATRVWTDITSDVRTAPMAVSVNYGIQGASVHDLVAQTGTMTFALDNSEANSAGLKGYYSVGHTNCRSGFAVRAPVRMKVVYDGVTYYKFRGVIKSAPPIPGPLGERYTSVTCVDWMATLARTSASNLSLQVNQSADTVFGVVVDGARRPPAAVELNPSVYTFPSAIDIGRGEQDKLLSEAVRIASSTGALIYVKGDTSQGGTLVYEPRELRQAGKTLYGPFDQLRDLQPAYDDERIINIVRATYYPRRLDASATQTLAELSVDVSSQYVLPLHTITLQASYKDPSQKIARIGGTDMSCVSGTDFTFNSAADGSGTNLTSSIQVTTTFLANMVEWTIYNPTGTLAYITLLRARGRAIYYDDPVTIVEPPTLQSQSIRKHDERELSIDLPYEGTAAGAREYAGLILAVYSDLATVIPNSITINGNKDADQMTHALAREVGDLIGAEETQTGITTSAGWYIQNVGMTFHQVQAGVMVNATWGLAPSWPESLVGGYTGAATGFHNFTYGGQLVLTAPGDYTFTFNRTGEVLRLTGCAGGGGGGAGSADSTNNAAGAGGSGGTCQLTGINVMLSTTTYTGKVGVGGAGGASGGQAGTAGGTTEFRIPSGTVYMQLPGGPGGGGASGATPGTAGGAAGSGTGAGNVQGGTGGNGHAHSPNNTSGAAGGGGGGDSGLQGGDGGDGRDQLGANGGTASNAGGNASGFGGGPGSGTPGGGGGGGGGVQVGGLIFGGGGGGGAGAQSSHGGGGAGGHGGLVMEIAP